MEDWKNFVRNNALVEPPPELPLQNFAVMERYPKEFNSKGFVNKFKGWFNNNNTNSANTTGNERSVLPNSRDNSINKEAGELKQQIYLMDEERFAPNLESIHDLVEDSTKTFMTGNNVDTDNIPHFPRKEENDRPDISLQEESFSDIRSSRYISKPVSHILKDSSVLSSLSSSLNTRSVKLRTVTRRLHSIANKKNETSKMIQKFLRDLSLWGQSSSSENPDSIELVKEIQELFQMDLILEKKIAEKLTELTKEIEYICLRQDELSLSKKNLITALRKYEHSRNRKSENKEESSLLREKVVAQEKSYEACRAHYQYAISVTARQLFKEIGIEYYERSTDLKEATGDYLKTTLQNLETNNGGSFVKDLERLRIIRAERNWSKLNANEKNNPRSWVDLVSGKHDENDTLMKKVCNALPKAYTSIPQSTGPEGPELNFQTGLEESLSAIPTDRFNPITSNEFFLEKSPNKGIEDDMNTRKAQDRESFNDENATKTRSLNPKVLEKESTTDNTTVLSIRNNLNVPNSFIKRESTSKRQGKSLAVSKNNDMSQKTRQGSGFILNFGGISQQFNDAEKHLQENRWIESP